MLGRKHEITPPQRRLGDKRRLVLFWFLAKGMLVFANGMLFFANGI
jgi:hypothetical protein